jgi:hypothetical protein
LIPKRSGSKIRESAGTSPSGTKATPDTSLQWTGLSGARATPWALGGCLQHSPRSLDPPGH